MRCTKTGADIIVMSDGKPYQIWVGDIFGCLGCGVEIVTGWGNKPWKLSHEPNFDDLVNRLESSPSHRVEYVYEKPTPKGGNDAPD